MNAVKYPEISVELMGQDGNAFLIIGKTARALRAGGVPREEIEQFQKEAMGGNYDHLLQTVMRWVSVD